MRKRIVTIKQVLIVVAVIAALVAAAVLLSTAQRQVKVLTGEIIICTAGEIIEDNTEEIEVPEGDVADYGVTTRVATCDAHGDLEALYQAAQKAIADGDLVTARERLATIVERDPSYRNASAQLATINEGAPPAADPGSPTPVPGDTTTPGDSQTEVPTGPVVSLTKYAPDTIAGYVAQGILADPASLSRQYLPTSKDSDQMVIEVEQRVDAAAADAARQSIAAGYPNGRAERTIAGRPVVAGYSGQYAAAVFTDGAITVVVEIHATGSSGAQLIDAAFAVAQIITK